METSSRTVPHATFRASPVSQRAVASRDDVLAAIGTQGMAYVVDALSKASFPGADRTRYRPRKRHIAGAVNAPMARMIDGSRSVLLPVDKPRAEFERAGMDFSRPVITY